MMTPQLVLPMSITGLCTILVAFALLVYGIFIYNQFVWLRNNIAKAWANIDVLLLQRGDEISKLVQLCQHYMQYEQETLQQVVLARDTVLNARALKHLQQLPVVQQQLQQVLNQLLMVAENYPDLKTQPLFAQLTSRISALEIAIADRRVFYNESVTAYNNRLQIIPDTLIAHLLRFKPAEWLKTNNA